MITFLTDQGLTSSPHLLKGSFLLDRAQRLIILFTLTDFYLILLSFKRQNLSKF